MNIYLKMILPDDFLTIMAEKYSADTGRSLESLMDNASGKFNDGDIFTVDLLELLQSRGLSLDDFIKMAWGFFSVVDNPQNTPIHFRLDGSSKLGPELSTPGLMKAFMIQNVNTAEWMKNAGGEDGIYFEEGTNMAMVIAKQHVASVLKQLISQTPEFEFKAVPVHDALNLNAE
jgi:hypothetical protein